MELVQLAISHVVQDSLHLIHRLKRTSHIQEKTTIGILRCILDFDTRYFHRKFRMLGINFRRKNLEQRLDTIEHATIIASTNINSFPMNGYLIFFLAQFLVKFQSQGIVLSLLLGVERKILEQIIGCIFQFLIENKRGTAIDNKAAFSLHHR